MVYEHEIMPDSLIVSYYKMQPEGNRVVVYHQIRNEEGSLMHCVAETVWMAHADTRTPQS